MRLLFLCSIFLFLQQPGYAQERVHNIRFRVVDSTRLEIQYNLLTTQPGDSIYLQMQSRLRGALRILPEFIRGDIGVGVTAGTDRRIIWDALANGYFLNEEVQAKVLVKAGPVASRSSKSKPVVALAPITTTPPESKTVVSERATVAPKLTESVAVADPKLAETTPPAKPVKRTQPSKPSVFAPDTVSTPTPTPTPSAVVVAPTQPPASTTAVDAPIQPAIPQSTTTVVDSIASPKPHRRYAGPAWALLSAIAPGVGNIFVQTPKPKIGFRPVITVACYGAIAYGLMERQKANDAYAIYEQQKNLTEGEPYYQTANDYHHRYFLATRGALLVTAVDVVLTFVKGIRNGHVNKEARRIQGVTVRPGWQVGQPTAVLHYSF